MGLRDNDDEEERERKNEEFYNELNVNSQKFMLGNHILRAAQSGNMKNSRFSIMKMSESSKFAK